MTDLGSEQDELYYFAKNFNKLKFSNQAYIDSTQKQKAQNEKEIEKLKKDEDKKEKLKEINYMTLEQYKQKYIYKEFEKEKGVFINNDTNSINDFKNDQKIIRNLSQVSFRILNFILYIIDMIFSLKFSNHCLYFFF